MQMLGFRNHNLIDFTRPRSHPHLTSFTLFSFIQERGDDPVEGPLVLSDYHRRQLNEIRTHAKKSHIQEIQHKILKKEKESNEN